MVFHIHTYFEGFKNSDGVKKTEDGNKLIKDYFGNNFGSSERVMKEGREREETQQKCQQL